MQTSTTTVMQTSTTTVMQTSTTTYTSITPTFENTTLQLPPSITLTPASGVPGTKFTVVGSHFTPYGTVKSSDIMLNGIALSGSIFSVDGTGNVSFAIIIPTDNPPGIYNLAVTDSEKKHASSTFTVLTQTTTTSPTMPSPSFSNFIFAPNPANVGNTVTLQFDMVGGGAGNYTLIINLKRVFNQDLGIASYSFNYDSIRGTHQSFSFIPLSSGFYYITISGTFNGRLFMNLNSKGGRELQVY
jgi:hypothetical protein